MVVANTIDHAKKFILQKLKSVSTFHNVAQLSQRFVVLIRFTSYFYPEPFVMFPPREQTESRAVRYADCRGSHHWEYNDQWTRKNHPRHDDPFVGRFRCTEWRTQQPNDTMNGSLGGEELGRLSAGWESHPGKLTLRR